MRCGKKLDFSPVVVSQKMQRSLFQQAVRMHGQNLSVLTEKHLHEDFIFMQEENDDEQLADQKAGEDNHRESALNHPDTTPGAPYQDSVRLTGTMRDLVHVQSRSTTAESSAEESSKSDTSPEILPLGVPRELHEPFDDLSTKTKLFKDDGFVSQLHNFISKKAHLLFKPSQGAKESTTLPSLQDTVDLDYYATLPPMEQFMVIPPDQSRKRLFEILAVGDIIAGSIVAIKDFGMFVQVVCLCGKDARYLQECDIVGLLPKGELGDRYSQKSQLEDFRAGDVVRCRVVKTDAVNEKVILTMINQGEQNDENLLGIINEGELPVHYRRSQTQRETQESYDEMLDNTLGFDNPYNVSCLANMLDIDDTAPPSLMPGLQSANFPTEEHAEALRKWQSHKWAMESVARGVEHFKASRYLEAMQQLNRALEIDAENVEGLVARGALFANQNNLSKAIKDFAEALRIKPSHKNANRYMCQTLYEKGKQCEDNDEKDKAKDCYQSAVDLNPDFKDALVCLQRLEKTSRRSVKDNSEEEVLVTSSEESPQEQISAKQLREMITEEKSSTKKKKKKDKQSQGHEDGKGDTKVKKELKMAKKKKKKKKLRRRSSSSPEISKLKQKEPSSDSESESSEPPSPVPKHKRGSKEPKEVQSPERGRLTGKKRSRNGSLSPKRKSRSKTRKADLIRKKSKHASETSSSNDDDKMKEVKVTDKRNHRKSMERISSVKAKHKVDLNRSRKDSDSSEASSSDEEPVKKREGKKESKDQKAKEVSPKKRKMKTKKDKIKRSRSSSSVSEESADSPSYSPMRKKSKPAKKAKKMHKRSKKRSDSVTSGSDSGSDSERKSSPPRKAHKKKKKNKKKKAKKKERASSVSSRSVFSSESAERPKSTEEHSNRKFKKNTKGDDHYSDRSSLESSSSSEQQKVTNKKKDSKARIDGDSPIRRSRSTSLVKKERPSKGSSDEGEEIKIGKKRSRSSEYSIPQVKDHPKRQSSREAGHSPTNERRQRMTSDEESEEHSMKKAGHKGQKRLSSPEKEESKSDMKDKTGSKQKIERKEEVDKSSRRSKRHSKAESPSSNRKHRSASRERNKSDDRDKKESRKSRSPACMSPERKEPSGDYKHDKLDKHSEFGGDGSSREKNKFDEKDKKRQQRSYSSASESPPRKGKVEEHKEAKSGKHSRTREDSHERLKLTRRSRSLSPKGKREEEKKERTPIRERKRKRSGSFKDDTNSLEMERRDRKSRDIEKEEKVRHRKESGETRSRFESPEGSRYRPRSADSGKNARKESPIENKKSQSKHSPSPWNKDRSRSREDVNQNQYSRSGRSTSVDFHDRQQRSKSGSYEREKDKEHDNRSKDKNTGRNRRESKEESRRRSGSIDREGPSKERKLSDGDHHKNSDETNNKDRPRSREDEKIKESRDAERRTSHDVIRDDRDRGRDRNKESQYHDLDRSRRRESRDRERSREREGRDSGKNADSFGENGRKSRERSRERDRKDSRKNADSSQENRRKSREREGERSRERSRERDSAKNVDNSRERKERSSEREKGISGSRFESNSREQKIHSDSSQDIGKAGTKAKEGEHHQMPSLNIEDIPMPPEKLTPVVEDKKEPSPILYVTSSSCKDEIIKVKSKWDTDSEDDESGASGPSQNRRGGGGRGASGGPKSFVPSSQYRGSNVGGNAGGGKNYGGNRRHADDSVLENTSYNIGISETSQCCQHLSVDLEQAMHHEPLRLRGGCVASPPPKYESDHSDSDVSFSSSSNVDSEEPKQDSSYEDHSSVGRRYKSSSSDRSSGERSKKRFKLSRRRESQSSSRSSSTSSSGSWSSRSSSRSDISHPPRDKSRSPSSERSSSSYRSYGSNSKSSKEQKKTLRQDDQGSNTETSDAECADEYNLFDSWEDYMDTRGHNLGKELHSSIREQRTVKLETGGSTVGKFNRNSPVHTDSEEDQESPSKTVQTENPDDDNAKCDEDITDSTECENEQKTCGDLGENKESGTLEKAQGMKNQAPILYKEVQLDRHSRKRDRDDFASSSEHEANKVSHYQGSSTSSRYGQYGFRAVNVRQENYRHNENLNESYPVEYGNQLKVRLSHGSDRHHDHVNAERRHGGQWSHDHRSGHNKDERHHRGDGNYRENHHHSRHTYPQREERQDYHRHSQRGYGNHRRREHGFRRRRDDDDWGRGVKEVQERGTFLGLVTKSKEGLVSQLYSVCYSALDLVRSDHRQWWL